MPKTIVTAVRNRILGHGPGWCFTPKHFIDLNSDTGVRAALSRLEHAHMIRRLAQGLYEYPRNHATLGLLPPQADEIAAALSEKNSVKIQPTGAYAANLVGLTEQVPGRIEFLTTGAPKRLTIGKLEIIFRTAREKTLHAEGKTALVIQALRNIGKASVDDRARARIGRFLEGVSPNELRSNLKYAPRWIRELVVSIMGDKE